MLITKELPIQQAKNGEVYGNKVAENSKDFKLKIHQYGITDLFDPRLVIKQDKNKYIFAVDGKNDFAVNGKVNFITYIHDFYKDLAKDESRATEKKAIIEVSELEKRTKVNIIYTETEKDLAELSEQIKKNETLEKKSTNLENVKFKVERLLTFYEQELDLVDSETSGWIFNRKYDRKDKGIRKMHKTEVKRRIKELKKIKEQIERLANNKDRKYEIKRDIDKKDGTRKEFNEVKMDDINGADMKTTLRQLGERIEELGKEAPDFIMTRNDILLEKGDTVPYYEIIIHDRSDAKKITKALNKINNEYVILNKLELTTAKKQELSQDLQALETYLNNVIANPDTFKPSEHPFVPTHTVEFAELVKVVPEIAAFAQLNKTAGDKYKEAKPSKNQSTGGINVEGGNVEGGTTINRETQKPIKEYTNSPYGDTKEAFEKGGIGGVLKHGIDQTNMKPEQKQFWAGVGNVALIGGTVFLGWKMISSAFKLLGKKGRTGEELNKNLARLGIPTALIFGAQARSGEGPMKVFTGGELTRRMAGIFGGSNNKETRNQTLQEQETRLTYAEGFPGATALFNGLNYGEMKQFLIQDEKQTKINPAQYDTLLNMFKSGSKKNEAAAAFLESIGKDDKKNVVNLALTGMGISRNEIQNEGNKDKKFDKAASESIARLGSVTIFMEQNGFNKISSETQYLVDEYISSGKNSSELNTLMERGDVFYKETEIIDQTGLAPQIKEIAKGDNTKEKELLLGINTFYKQMPNATKKIEIIGTGPTITFKTYDQSSTINLDNKELVGFTPTRFKSYAETFKAANLTNRIKFICKDKEAKSEKPFYLSTLIQGKDITFDNASIFSIDFDTEIIKSKSLKNVSPLLDTYKQEYCDYLNSLKFWKPKPMSN